MPRQPNAGRLPCSLDNGAHQHLGIWPAFAAAIASLLTGAAVVVTRFIVETIPPLPLAWLRYLLAVLVLLLPLLWLRDRRITASQKIACLGLGSLFFGVFTYCFNTGLETAPAARGGTLVATMPVVTLMLAAAVGLERISWMKLLGVGVALVGVAVVLGIPTAGLDSALTLRTDDLWLLTAACCGAVYNVGARIWLQQLPTVVTAFWSMSGGVLLLTIIATATGEWPEQTAATWEGVASLAYLGVAAGAVGFSLWIWALGKASPTQVAVFYSLNPVSAAILAAWALNEAVEPNVIIGLVVVVVGIVATTLSPREER